MERVMVSACLLGVESRYDGRSRRNAALIKRLKGQCVIPVCPEQLGGLPTPREPASFQGGDGAAVLRGKGRVVAVGGRDMTQEFIKGAREVLRLARLFSVKKAYFKAKSPSCGCGRVYFGETIGEGVGVCTALLLQNGVQVLEVE